MKTWKEDNFLIKFNEQSNTSPDLILSSPDAYFKSVNYIIPQDSYKEVISNLFALMSRDSDPTEKEVGKWGKYAYEICEYLANNGKNPQFAQLWNQMKSGKVRESRLRED